MFFAELLRRAGEAWLNALGTTALAVAIGYIQPLWKLYWAWKKEGLAAMGNHLRETLLNGTGLALIALIVLFLFHLVYTVPHQIRTDADRVNPPFLTCRTPAPPPLERRVVARSDELSPPLATARAKEIMVKSVTGTLASVAGQDTISYVHLDINEPRALKVRAYKLSAVQPVYTDRAQRRQLEDELWKEMILQGPGDISSVLPANIQDLTFAIGFSSVSANQIAMIKAGTAQYYFMGRMEKKNGKLLLDTCFSVDRNTKPIYCSSHNGP